MSESDPNTQSGQSPEWLDQGNVDAAMISSDLFEAAQQLDRISGRGIDPKKAKEVGTVALPSEISQKADWPGAETSQDTVNKLPAASGSDWYRG